MWWTVVSAVYVFGGGDTGEGPVQNQRGVKMRLTLDTGKKIRKRYEKLRLELEGRQEW